MFKERPKTTNILQQTKRLGSQAPKILKHELPDESAEYLNDYGQDYSKSKKKLQSQRPMTAVRQVQSTKNFNFNQNFSSKQNNNLNSRNISSTVQNPSFTINSAKTKVDNLSSIDLFNKLIQNRGNQNKDKKFQIKPQKSLRTLQIHSAIYKVKKNKEFLDQQIKELENNKTEFNQQDFYLIANSGAMEYILNQQQFNNVKQSQQLTQMQEQASPTKMLNSYQTQKTYNNNNLGQSNILNSQSSNRRSISNIPKPIVQKKQKPDYLSIDPEEEYANNNEYNIIGNASKAFKEQLRSDVQNWGQKSENNYQNPDNFSQTSQEKENQQNNQLDKQQNFKNSYKNQQNIQKLLENIDEQDNDEELKEQLKQQLFQQMQQQVLMSQNQYLDPQQQRFQKKLLQQQQQQINSLNEENNEKNNKLEIKIQNHQESEPQFQKFFTQNLQFSNQSNNPNSNSNRSNNLYQSYKNENQLQQQYMQQYQQMQQEHQDGNQNLLQMQQTVKSQLDFQQNRPQSMQQIKRPLSGLNNSSKQLKFNQNIPQQFLQDNNNNSSNNFNNFSNKNNNNLSRPTTALKMGLTSSSMLNKVNSRPQTAKSTPLHAALSYGKATKIKESIKRNMDHLVLLDQKKEQDKIKFQYKQIKRQIKNDQNALSVSGQSFSYFNKISQIHSNAFLRAKLMHQNNGINYKLMKPSQLIEYQQNIEKLQDNINQQYDYQQQQQEQYLYEKNQQNNFNQQYEQDYQDQQYQYQNQYLSQQPEQQDNFDSNQNFNQNGGYKSLKINV
ncbi:hypothetical protein PPERSA_06289 [Pseudocohnilembus persalinus]|uniref:Uncharacterized protein n=1 Tax=Pseudocohnilembus persalinus TaxID=266149 RepID=A0A0V0QVS3_PSEPJ|nr:hypothetical protein PPERSA_06289 [Pseudocohnilembus persalinus]|eukprot:KRX06318.1 hypothetical protein PPERSA_06289 [Pseudocohnilembus persalinus]